MQFIHKNRLLSINRRKFPPTGLLKDILMTRTPASTLRTLAKAATLVSAIAGVGSYTWAAQTTAASSTATKSNQHSNTTPHEYHIYRGNTHSHSSFTWSHGEQWAKSECRGVPVYAADRNHPEVHSWSPEGNQPPSGKCPSMIILGSTQYPGPYNELRSDWNKHQAPPSEHYALAKENGYDFYAVTDHSQDAGFQPPAPTNTNWMTTKREAAEATNAEFVAIAGYEHSENDGPNGVGHINVFNSAGYLNALDPGVDLPHFYNWLKTAKPNGAGLVVASFNHPGAEQYNDWAYRDPQITDINHDA
jgi:hypothetical protein